MSHRHVATRLGPSSADALNLPFSTGSPFHFVSIFFRLVRIPHLGVALDPTHAYLNPFHLYRDTHWTHPFALKHLSCIPIALVLSRDSFHCLTRTYIHTLFAASFILPFLRVGIDLSLVVM
jgi:hypothetical protein